MSDRPRLHAAAAAFWQEWYRELRRHAGDERLPYALRTILRRAADGAMGRAAAEDARSVVPRLNRRQLRDARAVARSAGLRTVAIDVRLGERRLSDAIDLLSARGYQIVRIDDQEAAPSRHARLLAESAFVICSSAELQHAACVAGTPSLRLDARDPFTAYPVRQDGLFTLATAIDLDTGRPLAVSELLTERYFRNTRNCGYRPTPAHEVAAAVEEMLDGVANGWQESDAQARFRIAVADAGKAIGPQVRHIAEWDAASGFIGDGRLASIQAERAL